MNSNPYEFSNVDDPAQNMNAAGHACPELFDVIHIKGSLSKSEALRLAAKCRAIPQRDTKTGTVTNTNYGLLLLCGAGILLIYCTVAKLVKDIRTANSEFENVLFWMTNIVIPLVSIATLNVLYWRHRFRIDTADPPIWGDVKIELDAKWYSAERYCQNGKLRQALYRWPMTQVLASRDAWLLQPPGLSPVLIPGIWLAEKQQVVVEHFLDNLMQWQYLPASQQSLASLPSVFPPMPKGIHYKIGPIQHAEFERIATRLRPLFPNMPGRATIFSKPFIWKWWGISVFVCGLCPPAYIFMVGSGTINLAFLLACTLGLALYLFGRSVTRNVVPEVSGIITSSAVWFEMPSMQTWTPLEYFTQFNIVEDIFLLSSEYSKGPLWIPRSSFSTDADWQNARQRIEAAIPSRASRDEERAT